MKNSQNNIRAQIAGALTGVRDRMDWRAGWLKEDSDLADVCRKSSIHPDTQGLMKLISPVLGAIRSPILGFWKDGKAEKPTGQKERKYSKEGVCVPDPRFYLSRRLLAAGRDDLKPSAA